MNKVVLLLCLSVVAADRLSNLQKAPLRASLSAGDSNVLTAPLRPIVPLDPVAKPIYPAAPSYKSREVVANHPTHQADIIPILRNSIEPNYGDGAYAYSYETANGISMSEHGTFQPGATEEDGIQSSAGSFSYIGPDNVQYSITYTAGPEGFVPVGSHIPTLNSAGRSAPYQPQYQPTQYSQDLPKYNSIQPLQENKITGAFPKKYSAVSQHPYTRVINPVQGNPIQDNQYKTQENEYTE